MRRTLLTALVLITAITACGKKDDIQPESDQPPTDDPTLRLSEEVPIPMRGYKSINNLIKERMMNDPDFELVHYIQKPDIQRDQEGGSVVPLFGGYDGRGLTMTNQSALPGTMNMLLWFSVFDALGHEISKYCLHTDDPNSRIALNSSLAANVTNICNPAHDPHDDLSALWDFALRYDATPYAKEEWLSWLKEPENTPDAPAPTLESRSAMLRDAIITALFSAEFLAGR